MKIAIINFTEKGNNVSLRLKNILDSQGDQVSLDTRCRELRTFCPDGKEDISLGEWTGEKFAAMDALIYVGAVGIAVRAIAPFVEHKTKDPAVLVVDELARYCIPLLSGHIGGANELAERLCEDLSCGMIPVITTATDLNHKWAVDVFAKKNHLKISDMEKAKKISAGILAGDKIRIYLEEGGEICGGSQELPEELHLVSQPELADIYIGVRLPETDCLRLIPSCLTVGIGCRKGTTAGRIEAALSQVFESAQISREGLRQVASIDLKAEETGILRFCEKYEQEYRVYPAEQLKMVPGEYQPSAFVSQITGVDNVCERSAVCAEWNRQRRLPEVLVKKTVLEGVTIAVTAGEWSVSFE